MPDQDKQRKINDLQRETVMLESDLKKQVNAKNQIEVEIRGLEKEEARLRASVLDKQAEIKKIDQEIMLIENDLHGVKKKINLL